MNRLELKNYIWKKYRVASDFPWSKHPFFEVFRHSGSQKWFALIMEIPKSKLGLPSEDPIEIVNFKCDPMMIGSLLLENGFFPAYHMNKEHWITIALDGSVPDDKLKLLLDMSFHASCPK